MQPRRLPSQARPRGPTRSAQAHGYQQDVEYPQRQGPASQHGAATQTHAHNQEFPSPQHFCTPERQPSNDHYPECDSDSEAPRPPPRQTHADAQTFDQYYQSVPRAYHQTNFSHLYDLLHDPRITELENPKPRNQHARRTSQARSSSSQPYPLRDEHDDDALDDAHPSRPLGLSNLRELNAARPKQHMIEWRFHTKQRAEPYENVGYASRVSDYDVEPTPGM